MYAIRSYYALVLYSNGERRYIIAPKDLGPGSEVMSGPGAAIRVGNAMPLRNIPLGTIIHCVELKVGKGAQLGRSAGAAIQYVAREGDYAQLRLRSGEVRITSYNVCYTKLLRLRISRHPGGYAGAVSHLAGKID